MARACFIFSAVYVEHCRVGLMALFEDGTKLWCSVHINGVQAAAAAKYTAYSMLVASLFNHASSGS